jgi:hypothetical protein
MYDLIVTILFFENIINEKEKKYIYGQNYIRKLLLKTCVYGKTSYGKQKRKKYIFANYDKK